MRRSETVNDKAPDSPVSRRRMLASTAGLVAAGVVGPAGGSFGQERSVKKGRLKQSVCKWGYKMPVEELAVAVRRMGRRGEYPAGRDADERAGAPHGEAGHR